MSAQQNFRVDSFVSDKAIKAPCQAISVLNLTLSGAQTVNGVAVVAGDRVLVAAQTVPSENGIYNVEQAGWNRAADWDGNRDVTAGTLVIVAGTPLISLYQLDVTGTFTIGTSNATFTLLSTLNLAGNLASTVNGLGASLVGIEDVGANYTAADVEAALAELSSVAAGEGASIIGLEDAAGLYAATNVEAALAEVIAATKYKTADESRTATITVVDDTDLSGFALDDDTTYVLEAYLVFSCASAVPQVRWIFQYSDAPQGYSAYGYWASQNVLAIETDYIVSTAGETVLALAASGAAGKMVVTFKGSIRSNATTGGTLDFQWAQGASNANQVLLETGSWMSLRKLGAA